MNSAIRKAQAQDIQGILTLFRELRPNDPELAPHNAARLFEHLLQQEFVHMFVVEVEAELVATCTLAVIPNLASGGRSYALIEHVVTLAAHRGHGYGRAVLNHAIDFAWNLDCYKVMLLSGAQRPEAHKLYESLGFNGDVERGFVKKRLP